MLAVVTLAIYAWALDVYGEGAHARTVALMALVGVQLGHMFNCRSRTRSAFEGLFRNPFIWLAAAIVIALQLMAVYLTPLSRVLNTTRLTSVDWLMVTGAVFAPIMLVEVAKSFSRWKRARVTIPRSVPIVSNRADRGSS